VGSSQTNGLFKTTNGGNNWIQQNLGLSDIAVNDITFIGYNTGWCAGRYSDNTSMILKTSNGSGILPPVAPTLISPPNNSTGQSLTPLLDWDSISNADYYSLQVSSDNFITTVINQQNILVSQYQVLPSVLSINTQYSWKVKAYNIGGESPWSTVWNFTTAGIVGISQKNNDIPKFYKLYNNYPNPFNPITKIKFDIPSDEKNKTKQAKLVIYDINGREVVTLLNAQLNPGTYEIGFEGSNYPSGVYFYELNVGDYKEMRKMILVK
jgi:hypothetical protein